MSDTSLILDLPYIQAAQAQKHVTHNEALRLLDVIVQLSVKDRTRTTAPEAPDTGDRHIVAAKASGIWAGQDGKVAFYDGTGWSFVVPKAGWQASVLEEQQTVIHDGSAWRDPQARTLGINTSADAVNRLAVSAPASIFTHEGAGHQIKVNKAGTANTASLLFQSNYSGRAEMGLAGDDRFSVKVSANGNTFYQALTVDSDTGAVTFPGGAAFPDGSTAKPGLRFSADDDTGLLRAGTDQIGFVTGGTQRASLSKTTLKLDLPLTGTAVTQSTSDATAGRVTRVGDFGLGGQTESRSADATATTGFAHATSGTRPDSADWHLVHLSHSASGSAAQIGLRDGADADAPALALRHRGATGTWAGWSTLYGSRNLLGTVAQSSGVPTGSAMERGSNANGDYVRFADGTQICTRICSVNVATTAVQSFATAMPFVSGVVSASVSHVSSAPHNQLLTANISVQGCAGSAFFLRLVSSGTSANASADSEKVVMQAIGRWF
ncbi:DUF2793 domain-containing protein [Falsirhodobacter sp. alg1]|uniref:DUF2793 domain-containing protein n=1 Tax=Falsirhodobacter sp. alg1 TaxID=1472418 RepID=UPI000788B313|nr:DUF2793 domain-containing protein [Falsirhodobacter sp. alg1]